MGPIGGGAVRHYTADHNDLSGCLGTKLKRAPTLVTGCRNPREIHSALAAANRFMEIKKNNAIKVQDCFSEIAALLFSRWCSADDFEQKSAFSEGAAAERFLFI